MKKASFRTSIYLTTLANVLEEMVDKKIDKIYIEHLGYLWKIKKVKQK
jgi:CYTH domain-containing protein